MSGEARAVYLTALLERYGSVRLPLAGTPALPLIEIFQPMRLRHDPLAAEDLVSRPVAPSETPTEPVIVEDGLAAIARSPGGRMIVLGGPGSGKTTLLLVLLRHAAELATTDPQAPVPIYLSLPHFARAEMPLAAYVAHITSELAGDRAFGAALAATVETHQAYLLLDGLDEVPPALRPDLIAMLNRAVVQPGGQWVIASRFTEYKGGQFAHAHFSEWELLPLDIVLRRQLADRLWPVLSHATLPGAAPASNPAAFVAAIEGHPLIAPWGENPLLLSLAALLYIRQGALPTMRVTLFAEVIDAILTARTPAPEARAAQWRLLAQVALRLFMARGRTCSHDELLALVAELRPDRANPRTRHELAHQLIGSGVLIPIGPEASTFWHQTFQEYLAARALATAIIEGTLDWEVVWSKRLYSRWTEVLRLLVGEWLTHHGEAGRQAAVRWMHDLLRLGETPEGDVGSLGVALAVSTLGELAPGTLPVADASDLYQRATSARLRELVERELHPTEREQRAQQLAREIQGIDGTAADQMVQRSLDLWHAARTVKGVPAALQIVLKALTPHASLAARLSLAGMGPGKSTEKDRKEDEKYEPLRIIGLYTLRIGEGTAALARLMNAMLHCGGDEQSAAAQQLTKDIRQLPPESLFALLISPRTGLEGVLRAAREAGMLLPQEQVVPLLHATEASTRCRAIRWLADQLDVAELEAMLQDEDWQVRAVVIEAMGKRTPLVALGAALTSPAWRLRDAAAPLAMRLGLLGLAPILPALVAVQDDEIQRFIRYNLLEPLLKTHVAELPQALASVPPETAVRLLRLSFSIKDQLDLDWLVAIALSADHPELRQTAYNLLNTSELRDRLPVAPGLAALEQADGELRTRGIAYLALAVNQCTPADFALVARLAGDPRQWSVIPEAAPYYKQIVRLVAHWHDPQALEMIMAALALPWPPVQEAALLALGDYGPDAPLEPLLAALANPHMIATAVNALRQRPGEIPLAQAQELFHHRNAWIQQSALEALGPAAPLDLLLDLMQHGQSNLQREASLLLSRRAATLPLEAYEIILGMLDQDWLFAESFLPAWAERAGPEAISWLLVALENSRYSLRRCALELLEARRHVLTIEQMASLATSRYSDVQQRALHWLGVSGTAAAIPVLLQALNSDFLGVYQVARRGLLNLVGTVDVTELLTFLCTAEVPEIAEHALAMVLAWPEWPLEPVITVALHGASTDLRQTAVEALGTEANRLLKAGASDPSAGRLGQLAQALNLILQDPSGMTISTALDWFPAELGNALYSQGIRERLHMFLHDDQGVALRAVRWASSLNILHDEIVELASYDGGDVAEVALEHLGANDIPFLFARLVSGDTGVMAHNSLIYLGAAITAEDYREALDTTNLGARQRIADVLACTAKDAPLAIALELAQDGDPQVRRLACQAMGIRHAPEALPALTTCASDGDSTVKAATMTALGSYPFELTGHFLANATTDPQPSVRQAALAALARQGDAVPLATLLDLVGDPVAAVQQAAVQALLTIGTPAAQEALRTILVQAATPELRRLALLALQTAAPQKALVSALDDPDDAVRAAGWEIVQRAPTVVPMSTLLAFLKAPDPVSRARCLQTLQQAVAAGVAVPITAVLPLLQDSVVEVRLAAVTCLISLDIVEPLLPLIHDPAGEVRALAFATLAQRPDGAAWLPIEEVTAALADYDKNVRAAATILLGRYPATGAAIQVRVLLLDLLNDTAGEVRQAAVRALLQDEPSPTEMSAALCAEPKVAMAALVAGHGALAQRCLSEAEGVLLGTAPALPLAPLRQRAILRHLWDLALTTPAIYAYVVPFLDDDQPLVRLAAIQTLGTLRRSIPDVALHRLLRLRVGATARAERAAADSALGAVLSLEAGIEDA